MLISLSNGGLPSFDAARKWDGSTLMLRVNVLLFVCHQARRFVHRDLSHRHCDNQLPNVLMQRRFRKRMSGSDRSVL